MPRRRWVSLGKEAQESLGKKQELLGKHKDVWMTDRRGGLEQVGKGGGKEVSAKLNPSRKW